MAVMQMKRINICAMKKNRKAILERLQELGAMELDIRLENDSGYERQDASGSKAAFEKQAQTADRALEILQDYVPEKAGILSSLVGKPLVGREAFEGAAANQVDYMATANRIVSLERQLAEKKASILKAQMQMESLTPWLSLTVPLDYEGTRFTKVMIGTMAAGMDLEKVHALLAWEAPEADVPEADVHIVFADRDYSYLAVICLNRDAQTVETALCAGGFARPSLFTHRVPAECHDALAKEIADAQEEVERLEKEIRDCAGSREDLRVISDYYRVRADKYEFLGQIPQTKTTFALSGYIPAAVVESVAREFSEEFDADIEVEEIGGQEEAPILLRNHKFSQSVEDIVASFGLPRKGEIDPTTVTSIFYVFLFGLMLSDAAYGIIISLACGVMLHKFPRMSEGMKRSIRLFFWCGLSTLFWGVMFGGYFGDLLTVVGRTFFGVEFTVPALWFAPLNEPMRLLLYSLLFGVIHMFTGLALRGYTCLRDQRYLDFFCDCVLWFMFLLGLLGMLLPTELFAGIVGQQIAFPAAVSTGARCFAVIGAVGILFMEGRDKQNPAVRIALGAYGLYGITGWLSDILSYSRLLALGLATGVIAQVVNQMGSMAGGGIVGALVFILVFLIGHSFNLAINLLGAYVHTNRLQYVEFFGKFYEGGGRAFAPFRFKTKYVDIKEENNLC
ncbi:MAG: V-type ATP synthase subunit I [Lachnospiraceae bacterium]|nr:V-type ATP synthase subunit I [Lachnospiraceae bacterium]